MHTCTVPARLIRFFTRYRYSHAAIALDRSCQIIYSFGRRRPDSILDGGFCVERQHGPFFRRFNRTVCKIYELEITNEQYDTVCCILERMLTHMERYKYDYFGIVPRFFGFPIRLKDRYVCSFFVAALLEQAGICRFDKDVCFVTPRDFDRMLGEREIYRGSYSAYKISSPV